MEDILVQQDITEQSFESLAPWLLFTKKISLKRKTTNVRIVKCKIKHTNKGLNAWMAQENTSPLQTWAIMFSSLEDGAIMITSVL